VLELTHEQKKISDAIVDFAFGKIKGQYLAVSGYAGTGKTTVMGYAAAQILALEPKKAIAYCAPTGKAASVLESKLRDFGAFNALSAAHTIHGHIYRLRDSRSGNLNWEKKSDPLPYDLFVVDEASMVTGQMFRDLLSFGKPVIFIGDPGQLPPVGDVAFQPLLDTEYTLETVHRQALENPIIAMATAVRHGETIPFCSRGGTFLKIRRRDSRTAQVIQMFVDKLSENDTMILCGTNNTRISINGSVRRMLGFNGTVPLVGEHLICLKNERQLGMFNGQIFTVLDSHGYCVNDACYSVRLDNEEEVIAYTGALNSNSGKTLRVNMATDNARIKENMELSFQEEPCLFDYGYACSVHKAQGSEWANVLLYDERTRYMDDADYARWLYTGMTRAKNRLCIIH
jgi:exodeoxyribonuclease-5